MKTKIEVNKMNEQLPLKNQIQKKVSEDVYHQINSVSFKQNFKMLIGHYANQTQFARQAAGK